MAWKRNLVYALVLGGILTLAEGLGKMFTSCCKRGTLKCVKCFPPIPSAIGLRETTKNAEIKRRMKDIIAICLESEIKYCERLVHSKLHYKDPVLYAELNYSFDFRECKNFVTEVCIQGSELRKRYLKHAECINQHFVNCCEILLEPDEETPTYCKWPLDLSFCVREHVTDTCGKDSTVLLAEWDYKVFREFGDCYAAKPVGNPLLDESVTHSCARMRQGQSMKKGAPP